MKPLLFSKPDTPMSSPKAGEGTGLGAVLPKKTALSVSLLGPSIAFTQPPQHPDDPGVDAQIAGRVSLQLPKMKRVSSLTVALVGTANLGLTNGYETGEVLNQTFTLLEDDLCVAGEHILEFCFSVPATAAPFDCSRYGRIQHRIVAHAKMGLLEPDLRSETIVGIIAAPPELDGSLFFNTENQHEELGPYTFGLSSSCLSVGGIVSIAFGLRGPPQPVTIDHIDLSIVQNFTLTSLTKRSSSSADPGASTFVSENYPPSKLKVLRLDGRNVGKGLETTHGTAKATSPGKEEEDEQLARGETPAPAGKGKDRARSESPLPLARLKAGESREFWHLIRLPRCKTLRPSTPAWVISPIHKTHQMEATICYTVGGQSRMLKIRKPVEVVSCNAVLSNLVLPAYAKTGPTPDYEPDPANAHKLCACYISTNVLMEWERTTGTSCFSNPDIMAKIAQPRPKYEATT